MRGSGENCPAMRSIDLEKQLVDASKNGDAKTVRILLEQRVSPNVAEYNKSLFYASQNYITPVQYAACNGYPEVLKLLIEHEADVNTRDRFDITAVHMAAEKGNSECLQILLDNEADCNMATKHSKHGLYRAYPHPGGTTPLHLAAAGDHVDCVRKLIWDGADYNATDEFNRTSLYIAAEKGSEDCVNVHLDNATWRAILSFPSNTSGDTPLHLCVAKGMLSCVKKLLEHGSDVSSRNKNGISPLHLAVHAVPNYDREMLRLLITEGYNVDVNVKDFCGRTPLHYVSYNENELQCRRPDAAALLIAYGADYRHCKRLHYNLLQNELLMRAPDKAIINAILKSESDWPSMLAMGMKVVPDNRGIYTDTDFIHSRGRIFTQSEIKWYLDLWKTPRPLQHYCRCVIRKALGSSRLSKIKDMSLPNTLKDYLLLMLEEFH